MKLHLVSIKTKFFKRGRWIVRLMQPYNGRSEMPYSHYVWITHCPEFKEIPNGYVLHHLGHDETNDDISNLALMPKGPHTPHHFKQNGSEIPTEFNETHYYYPIKEPKIREQNGRYYLDFYIMLNRMKVRKRIFKMDGKYFTTEAEAMTVKRTLWTD